VYRVSSDVVQPRAVSALPAPPRSAESAMLCVCDEHPSGTAAPRMHLSAVPPENHNVCDENYLCTVGRSVETKN